MDESRERRVQISRLKSRFPIMGAAQKQTRYELWNDGAGAQVKYFFVPFA